MEAFKKNFGKNFLIGLSIFVVLIVAGVILEQSSSDLPTGMASFDAEESEQNPITTWSIIILALGFASFLAFKGEHRFSNPNKSQEQEDLEKLKEELRGHFSAAWMHFDSGNYEGIQSSVSKINSMYKDLPEEMRAETLTRVNELYSEMRR